VELAHHLRSLNIYGILILKGSLLYAENEPEALDVLGELLKREPKLSVVFEVIQLEVVKIADEDVAREFVRLQAREVVERLLLRLDQIVAGALLLDDQNALPKKIDEAAVFSQEPDRFLEAGEMPARDSKHGKNSL
jgi:hypothetical protein